MRLRHVIVGILSGIVVIFVRGFIAELKSIQFNAETQNLTSQIKVTVVGSEDFKSGRKNEPWKNPENFSDILFPDGVHFDDEIDESEVLGNGTQWVNWVRGEDNIAFTREMQALLWRHQHPRKCEKAQFIVWPLFQEGLGKDLHTVSWALAAALRMGRVLLTNSTLHGGVWKYARGSENQDDGLNVYLQPLSNCTLQHATQSVKPFIGKSWRGMGPDQNLMPETYRGLGRTWFRAQCMRYIVRLNRKFARHLSGLVEPGGALAGKIKKIPKNAVSMHIRRSDKVGGKSKEMDAIPHEDYMNVVLNLGSLIPGIDTVFLSTEDGSVFRRITEAHEYANFTILSVPEDRHNLNHDAFVRRFGGLALMETSMLNLLLHAQCGYFVHTRASNWCRLIDEMRMTGNRASGVVGYLNGQHSWGDI